MSLFGCKKGLYEVFLAVAGLTDEECWYLSLVYLLEANWLSGLSARPYTVIDNSGESVFS